MNKNHSEKSNGKDTFQKLIVQKLIFIEKVSPQTSRNQKKHQHMISPKNFN